jgi:hypothetical protein
MQRVSAKVTAATALASAALVVFATATVYAKDVPSGRAGNPGNHYGEISNPGHHYGQYKHQRPVSTPSPQPQPQPQPTPGATTQTTTGGQGAAVSRSSTAPAAAGSSIADVPIVVPPATHPADNVVFANPAGENPLWWLVLLILPALLAVWVIVAGRMVQRVTRTRSQSAGALAGAPAT